MPWTRLIKNSLLLLFFYDEKVYILCIRVQNKLLLKEFEEKKTYPPSYLENNHY